MKTVACLGASLTAGTVSANYLHLLEARSSMADFRFVNHGVNGDLAWNGLQRLHRVIAEDPDYVSILIGTNDVNATLSERNLIRYNAFNHLPVPPTIEWYEQNMREIVHRLKKETHAKLALISLATIGENPEHEGYRKVFLYNDVIRKIAAEEKLPYLPFHERMIAYFKEHEADRAQLPPRLEYRDGLINIGNATALHATGLTWDEVSHRNGLLLSTDGIHLNTVAAGMIADLIEGWLIKETTSAV